MKGCFLAPLLVLNLIHGQKIDPEIFEKYLKKSTSFQVLSKDEQIAKLLGNGLLWNSKFPLEVDTKVPIL